MKLKAKTEAKLWPGSETVDLISAISTPAGSRLTPTAQHGNIPATSCATRSSRFIAKWQAAFFLGVRKSLVVLLQSLSPAADTRARMGKRINAHPLHMTTICISSVLYNSPTIASTPKHNQFRNSKSSKNFSTSGILRQLQSLYS